MFKESEPMIHTTTTTPTNRITMTEARSSLGITMKVLRRLLAKHDLQVDMLHRNCALMTIDQFDRIVGAYLSEQRHLLAETNETVEMLLGLQKQAEAA